MRNITAKITKAFIARQTAYLDNTRTDGNSLFLHENRIAEFRAGELWITTAGWNTRTTAERLNGLPGVRVNTVKGDLKLNGADWDGGWVRVSGGDIK